LQQNKLPAAADGTPSLSSARDLYVRERGNSLSREWRGTIDAAVRDLIDVVGVDKPVTAFSRADALTFKDVMLALPANWRKKREVRDLGIVAAAKKAAELGLPRQGDKTLRKKWSVLRSLFDYADRTIDGVANHFHAKSLVVSRRGPANEDWHPFEPDEL